MVFEKVRAILAEQLNIDESEINPDTNIADDLGATSLDVAELIMTLEEDFDLRIPDEEIDRIKTVDDIVKYIEQTL